MATWARPGTVTRLATRQDDERVRNPPAAAHEAREPRRLDPELRRRAAVEHETRLAAEAAVGRRRRHERGERVALDGGALAREQDHVRRVEDTDGAARGRLLLEPDRLPGGDRTRARLHRGRERPALGGVDRLELRRGEDLGRAAAPV